MDKISSIICMCLVAVICFTVLIIQSKTKVKKEDGIAAKAKLIQPEVSKQKAFFIKTTNYTTVPLVINRILPDVREETVQLAMEFCEHELLKNAAKTIDYKIRDTGYGRQLTATLLITNSQSSRDADC